MTPRFTRCVPVGDVPWALHSRSHDTLRVPKRVRENTVLLIITKIARCAIGATTNKVGIWWKQVKYDVYTRMKYAETCGT